ncbi:hypothetical protein [Mycobacterium sp. 3519A]|uniref:hypothetical protein n=1 Tax=Mycobacterium sp. 3519A TaxID=2057184 RepID=UPI000C79EF36|nr:hypothetical protein [Mycobacterium sp. 3519A]
MVGSMAVGVGVGVGEFSCETVVPEPPEALTDDVGPSPEVVVVVVCDPDEVVVVEVDVVVDVDVVGCSGSVPAVVAPEVPVAPDVVVPESVVAFAFDPPSVSGDPEVEFSPVAADATP